MRVFGNKVKHWKSGFFWPFLKITSSTTIAIESSRRDIFIEMVVKMFFFKNSQFELNLCLPPYQKKGIVLPKTGLFFI